MYYIKVKVSAVFVKDLSRPGINYIEVGKLTEEFFPDHDIRLVAVSDNSRRTYGKSSLYGYMKNPNGSKTNPVKLPEINVSVHTRQGVDIKYAV